MSDLSVVSPTIPPRAGLLRECVASVINQTQPPVAHIVAMDIEGRGAATTRNCALRGVDTEWVAFLDDDDLLYPHHLQVLREAAEEYQADVAYSWYEVLGGTDPFEGWEGRPYSDETLKNITIPVTAMCRTELAHEIGGFPIPNTEDWPQPTGEDWGFWMRLHERGAKFVYVDDRTWVWRHHGLNTSGRVWNRPEEFLKPSLSPP